jgi:hypothetical protein
MYIYLFYSIVMLLLWLVLYKVRKNLRTEMLFVSLFSVAGGFLEPLFVPEYWNPIVLVRFMELDIESFIFSFALGGIASVLYNLAYSRDYATVKKDSLYWVNRILIVLPLFLIAIIHVFTALNFMYVVITVIFIQCILVILLRPDLFYDMTLGGLTFAVFYGLSCFILSYYSIHFFGCWNYQSLVGIFFQDIPIEEFIWAFCFGTCASVIYKYVYNKKRS